MTKKVGGFFKTAKKTVKRRIARRKSGKMKPSKPSIAVSLGLFGTLTKGASRFDGTADENSIQALKRGEFERPFYNAVANMTGWDTPNNRFDHEKLIMGQIPLVAGTGVHKLHNWLGTNRILRRMKFPVSI